jgi:ribose transport system ATP-binding protein/inositol transport system ATP-binding protein
MGLYPRSEGKVMFQGKDISKMSTLDIQKMGLCLVPENRKLEGLILKNTIAFNMSISVVHKFINMLHVSRKKEEEIVNKGVSSLDVKTPSIHQVVGNLSGGNQQKVVIAKWLAAEPKLLIMDEPTRGVDVGAKAEIYKIMNDLVQQGIGIVMISSEMPETVNMCDRMYVMSEGKIRGELDKSEFTQEAILNLAMVED